MALTPDLAEGSKLSWSGSVVLAGWVSERGGRLGWIIMSSMSSCTVGKVDDSAVERLVKEVEGRVGGGVFAERCLVIDR